MTSSVPVENVLTIKLAALHDDVSEVKTALNKLSEAITKLALVEERQAQTADALERAFKAIGKIEDRLSALEQNTAARAPQYTEVAKWVDRGLVALAGAGAVVLARAAGIGS